MASTGPALWPSATTWPDVTTWPGQGTIVFVRCLLGFDDVSVASPAWYDASARLLAWSTSRGKQTELDLFDAGAASVTFGNRDGYLVAGGFTRPMNRVWLYAELPGETQDVFKGYAESWQSSWPAPGTSDAQMTVTATDEAKRLTGILTSTLTPTLPQTMYAEQWIGYVLDLASSTTPRRLDTHGNVESAINTTATTQIQSTVWSELQDAARYDGGDRGLFVTRSGEIRFVAGNFRNYAPGSIVQATFGDGGGSETPYAEITFDYSDSFLCNQYTATWASSPASATDFVSRARYGLRSKSEDFARYQVSPSNFATAFVAKYATPIVRATSLRVQLGDPDVALAVLRRELLDRIRVLRTQPGSSRIDQQVFIQKIDLSGAPGEPISGTLVVGLPSDAVAAGGWVLDVSTLDTSTRLA